MNNFKVLLTIAFMVAIGLPSLYSNENPKIIADLEKYDIMTFIHGVDYGKEEEDANKTSFIVNIRELRDGSYKMDNMFNFSFFCPTFTVTDNKIIMPLGQKFTSNKYYYKLVATN